MIGKVLNSVLPKCCLVPIERRRTFSQRYPLLWNAANIISVFRVIMLSIVVILPIFKQDAVVIWYVLLTLSDKLDGWVALLTGNNNGIGKMIDPLCDKVFHFIGLQYLLFSNLLDPAILGYLAMLFEALTLFVALACVHFVWVRKNESFKDAFEIIKQKISVNGFVNSFGKVKMVAYFLGIFFLLLYLYLPRFWSTSPKECEAIKNLYISFFGFGIFMAAIAFVLYIQEAVQRCRELTEKDLS